MLCCAAAVRNEYLPPHTPSAPQTGASPFLLSLKDVPCVMSATSQKNSVQKPIPSCAKHELHSFSLMPDKCGEDGRADLQV